MDLVYIDEQEGSTGQGHFTAISAALIPSTNVHSFRTLYYARAQEILNLSPKMDGMIRLEAVPVLHGRDLLRDTADDTKIAMVRALLDSFVSNGGAFARVGYYDKSNFSPLKGDREYRVNQAHRNYLMTFNDWASPFAFIHEADQPIDKMKFPFVSNDISEVYQLGISNANFDISNYIGNFIAPKYDLGCQVADIAGYIAHKADTEQSGFGKRLSALFNETYKSHFTINILIWWNSQGPE